LFYANPARMVPGMRRHYLLLIAIWGASFLLIKIGLEALAPLQVVLARLVFGALALTAVILVRRDALPREPRVWWQLIVAANLLNVVPFTLFAYAEQRIPSAMAAICNATTPLFTLLVVIVALPAERPTLRRAAGLALGFAGVFVVLGAWSAASRPDAIGVALALAASACYGVGGVYLRRTLSVTRYSGLALTTAQLWIGVVELAVIAPLATTLPTQLPVRVVLALAALGALGTGLAYALQHALIRSAGATLASTVTYGIPVVSIALGVVVLGERLAWHAPIGAAIIIAGAVLSRAPGRARAAAGVRFEPGGLRCHSRSPVMGHVSRTR
jgi:drug/metabolite transporter (DMT)-like permease